MNRFDDALTRLSIRRNWLRGDLIKIRSDGTRAYCLVGALFGFTHRELFADESMMVEDDPDMELLAEVIHEYLGANGCPPTGSLYDFVSCFNDEEAHYSDVITVLEKARAKRAEHV